MRFIDLVDKNAITVTDLRATYNKVNRYMLWQRMVTGEIADIYDEILVEVMDRIKTEK